VVSVPGRDERKVNMVYKSNIMEVSVYITELASFGDTVSAMGTIERNTTGAIC
jgi:hypothetical protein